MTNTHHAEMKELVIGRDLSWMDDAPLVCEKAAKYVAEEAENTKSSQRPQAPRKLPTPPSRLCRR